MALVDYWWQRYRWTLIYSALALVVGASIGMISTDLVTLPAPFGHRPTFFIAIFLGAVAAVALLLLLLSRAQAGLPILLGVIAFLPSRTGMQWQYIGYAIVSVADLAILLGMVILLLRAKVVHRERLRPVAISLPLWIWLVVGLVGLIVAVERGVPWTSYVPALKEFYLWPLIVILCVDVVRTRQALWVMMAVTVLSAIPNVFVAVHNSAAHDTSTLAYLPDGTPIYRVAGGGGLVNQFAFYIMAAFFIALGLAMASRRWSVRLIFYGCAALFLVGVALTYTRGAYVAIMVGVLVLGLVGGRRILAGLIVVAAITYFLLPPTVQQRLSFHDNSVAERVVYIHTATAAIKEYPFLGGGWGSNFYLDGKVLVPLFIPGDAPLWHDDYLVVATQVGVPGALVYLWIWGAIAWAMVRARRRAPPGPLRIYLLAFLAAVAAMFTQAFTDNFIWNNATGPFIWLVFGLICATVNVIDDEARLTSSVPAALEPEPRRRGLLAS